MLETATINGVDIVVKGIGKMFFQEGIPIGIVVKQIQGKGIKVSVLHIADELLKNGWKPERVIISLTHEFNDSSVSIDTHLLMDFCYADYEAQRDLIFESLFDGDVKIASQFLDDHLKRLIEWSNERIM